jgi:hypothetical protein
MTLASIRRQDFFVNRRISMKTGRLDLAAYLPFPFESSEGEYCGCLHSIFRDGGFAGADDCQFDFHG